MHNSHKLYDRREQAWFYVYWYFHRKVNWYFRVNCKYNEFQNTKERISITGRCTQLYGIMMTKNLYIVIRILYETIKCKTKIYEGAIPTIFNTVKPPKKQPEHISCYFCPACCMCLIRYSMLNKCNSTGHKTSMKLMIMKSKYLSILA